MELSRVSRVEKSFDAAALFPGAIITAVDVALVPVNLTPTAATVWTTATWSSPDATVLLAGPDASSAGALVVPPPQGADLWARVVDGEEVQAKRVERVELLDAAGLLPALGDVSDLYVAGLVEGPATATREAIDDLGFLAAGAGAGGALSGTYPNPGLNSTVVDATVAGRINDAASSTTSALRAAYERVAVTAVRRPLAAIGKAQTGSFRVLQIGTSVAAAAYAPNQTLTQALKRLYGNAGLIRYQAGGLGGTFDAAVNGWVKQPFSGVSYQRSRGSSSSTALTDRFQGYGDQVVVEWSRESDAASAEVFVDGVSVGTFGSAGTQKFGMRTTFTVTKGFHSITINPPASGFSYLEAVEIRDSARRGVETIDGTFGGSSLSRAVVAAAATGNQVAPVTTITGAGIEALFGRDDVDLILFSFTVNDAGANPTDPTAADYRAWLDQAVAAAKKRNIPVVLIIEPAGHYAIPNDSGNPNLHTRYEAVKAHQIAVADLWDHVFLADWDTATRIADIPTYAATYYPAVSALNVAAGTYSGDFVHPDGTLTNSSQDVGKQVLATTLGLKDSTPAEKTPLSMELGLITGREIAMRPYGLGTDGSFPRQLDALYRDTTATNLRPALNTLVTGSGLSDANGKYYLAVNYSYALGTISGQNMLVLRIGPNDAGILSVRNTDSQIHFYDPTGVEMGATLTGANGRQIHMSSLPAGTCIFLAVLISQDVNNKFLTINGRIYEAFITAASVPIVGAKP